jgi:hypothetical protein
LELEALTLAHLIQGAHRAAISANPNQQEDQADRSQESYGEEE